MGNNMTSTEHSRNVPQLRFPEFEGEWVVKKLGEIAETIGGGTPDTSKKEYWNGDIVWLTPTEIKEKYISNSIRKITKLGLQKSSAKLLPKGTLLFTSRATIGDIGIAEVECATNQGFQSFIPNSNYDTFFLYNWIIKNRKQFIRKASGSTFLEISKTAISTIKISIPTPPEQTKIATFLTAVDKRINLLQKKRAELSQYKKGVMQKLFSHELRFKKDDGSDFPDWEEKKLGSVTDIIKGKQLNKSELTEIGTYPAINGGIEPSGYTDEWNTIENTITISEGGNSCGYVNYIKTKFWSGGHCYSLLNLKESIDNTFLYQSLKYYQNRIMRLRVGSGLPNIQKGDIHNFKLPFPKKEEQQKIANFLSSLDKSIEKVEKQIEASQMWKKGLLQKMFV